MWRKSLKIKLKVILLSVISLSKQPIENIRNPKNRVSENKVQPNFGLSENIGGLKNQPAKNGAQVIENTTRRNFPFNRQKRWSV